MEGKTTMNEKLLVIDDDPGFCTLLTRLLSDRGYDVSYALGGEEALKKINAAYYDLLILDIKMPKVSGIDVLTHLRKIQKGKEESSVIIITGYTSETMPIEALKLGVVDYIVKPFEMADFLRSVEKNVDIHRLKKERNSYIKELAAANKELSRTVDELKATRDKLLVAERLAAIGKVASVVGHEIRNPLESIGNAAFLINKNTESGNPKIKKYLKILFKEMDNANNILNDLLDFSKEKQIVKSKISLKNAINESLESVNLDSRIKIKKELSPDADEIYADVYKLKQVFKNLLQNAAQSMPRGGVITISAKAKGEDIVITVRDTGCGIADNNLKNIFDPFFTTRTKGIGLGLAIVREIMEKHGGKIDVQSKLGSGTVFLLSLPKK